MAPRFTKKPKSLALNWTFSVKIWVRVGLATFFTFGWKESGNTSGFKCMKNEMPQHYAEAERMLGVTDNKIFGPADHMLKKMGEASSQICSGGTSKVLA
jgi:hypothetical protein